jgi:hypothetical protein
MAGSQTQRSLTRQLRAGALAAIVCLASVWLASALALAPMLGA